MDRSSPFPRWVPWTLGIVLVCGVVYALRGVLTPIFVAFLIAYILDPAVDWIEEQGFLRGAAIALLLFVFFIVATVAIVVLLPMVLSDLSEFVQRLPALVAGLRGRVEPTLVEYGVTIPTSIADALSQLHLDVQDVVRQGAKSVLAVLRWLAGGTLSVVGAIFAAVVIPVLAFYLLYDFDDIVEEMGRLVPPRFRDSVFSTTTEVNTVLGHFFRGQLTVMAILAVMYAVGYSLVGVALAIPIGLVAGLISFIPYVGGAVALGLALVMSLLEWSGPGRLAAVLAVYTVIQVLEGFVITPKIMGDTVGLSPVAILIALMIGGELLGFAGVLMAIPAAAVIKIFVQRGLVRYRASEIFGAENADEEPPPIPEPEPESS